MPYYNKRGQRETYPKPWVAKPKPTVASSGCLIPVVMLIVAVILCAKL